VIRTTPLPKKKASVKKKTVKKVKGPGSRKGVGGRPTKFSAKLQKQITFLIEKGLTDAEVAKALDITVVSLWNWKKIYPEFFKAVKISKDAADRKIEQSLFERASGWSCPEDKIFCNAFGEVTVHATIKHYAPDVTAQIFWLTNRKRDDWKRNAETQSGGKEDIDWSTAGFRASNAADVFTDSPPGAIKATG